MSRRHQLGLLIVAGACAGLLAVPSSGLGAGSAGAAPNCRHAGGGFLLNPVPRNIGPIFLCGGSEAVYPVTPKPGP